MSEYRGRIAPTPTGLLHVGHARTFAQAAERAKRANGKLIFRIEDLDTLRCRNEYAQKSMEDCRWLGLHWSEGPDVGGSYGPYVQSQRIPYYLEIWKQLHATGLIYPCDKSRKDVERALVAPHIEDEQEPVFPIELRPSDNAPQWAHVPLVTDAQGQRLAKRTQGLSIQELREKGITAETILTAPLKTLLS